MPLYHSHPTHPFSASTHPKQSLGCPIGIKGWVLIRTFPDEIVLNDCTDESGNRIIVVMADLDGADGADEAGDGGVGGGEGVGHHIRSRVITIACVYLWITA